jgi:hypothetical protein
MTSDILLNTDTFYGNLTDDEINKFIIDFADDAYVNNESKSKCAFIDLLLSTGRLEKTTNFENIIEILKKRNDKYTNYLLYYVYSTLENCAQLRYKHLFKAFMLGNNYAAETISDDKCSGYLEMHILIKALEDCSASDLKKFLDTIDIADIAAYKKLKKKLEIKQYKEKIVSLETKIKLMELNHAEEIEELLKPGGLAAINAKKRFENTAEELENYKL